MELIDAEILNKYIAGDDDLLSDLAVLFAKHLPDVEARLRIAVADQNGAAMRETSQDLKSRLGYLGASQLQDKAVMLEELGRSDQAGGAGELVEEILLGCRALLVELEQHTGLSFCLDDED